MANAPSIFDYELALPDDKLSARSKTLLGFDDRFTRIRDQLQLLLRLDELPKWSMKFHGETLPICTLMADQYPLVIFHGDVGTGKTTCAECIANKLVSEANAEDSILFKLSNRVRGSGKVGEIGSLLAEAFSKITASIGKNRRAILIIDEGDSLAAARSQEHSHHEDKVAVNTLIQAIDGLRTFGGRVLTIICTNRLSVMDAAIQRRATIIEEFNRPSSDERRLLLTQNLQGVKLSNTEFSELVALTGEQGDAPPWTFSDITTRLYPTALARAFPLRALSFDDLKAAAKSLKPSPVMEDK